MCGTLHLRNGTGEWHAYGMHVCKKRRFKCGHIGLNYLGLVGLLFQNRILHKWQVYYGRKQIEHIKEGKYQILMLYQAWTEKYIKESVQQIHILTQDIVRLSFGVFMGSKNYFLTQPWSAAQHDTWPSICLYLVIRMADILHQLLNSSSGSVFLQRYAFQMGQDPLLPVTSSAVSFCNFLSRSFTTKTHLTIFKGVSVYTPKN